MAAGWLELGAFWNKPGVPWTVRRATLQSKIIEAALSGLLSYVFSDVEYGRLDSKLCGYLRAMLGGTAHWVESGDKHRALTRLELFKTWRLFYLCTSQTLREEFDGCNKWSASLLTIDKSWPRFGASFASMGTHE